MVTPRFLRSTFFLLEKKIETMGGQMTSIIKAKETHLEEAQLVEMQTVRHLYFLFFNNPEQLFVLIEDLVAKIQTRKIGH